MLKALFPWKQNNTKKVLVLMEQQVQKEVTEVVTEEPPEDLPLLPCHVCNRTFLPRPLKKHIRICEQMAHKKRKPFDSLKQRIEGTDLAPFFQKSYLKKNNPDMNSHKQAGDIYGNKKQSKWKEKHLELVHTIRTAKGTSPDMITRSSSTVATPNRKLNHLAISQTSLNERCPSCDRAFGPKAFDRHVEWCQARKTTVQKSPANVQKAKERLEARIKYRVPPLKQPKRATVRAKYSPTLQTKTFVNRSNSMLTGKSTTSLGCSSTANVVTSRRKTINNSEKEKDANQGNRAHDSRSRFDKGIGDCGELKETEKSDTTFSKSFQTKRSIPIKKINNSTINNGLQDLTVSSLSVSKNKKLLTWKETAKLPPSKLEMLSIETSRKREERQPQLNSDSMTKHSKIPEDPKKRTSVKVVNTTTALKQKLNSFYKMKSIYRKYSENKTSPSKVSEDMNVRSSEERNVDSSQSVENSSGFDKFCDESSSVTVNTTDLECDNKSFGCSIDGEVNKVSKILVGTDEESILSLHGSANTVTYPYDESKNKNIVVVVKDKESNIIRNNETDNQLYVEIFGNITKDTTVDRIETSSATRSLSKNLTEKSRNTSVSQYNRQSPVEKSDMCAGDAQVPASNINSNFQKQSLIEIDSKQFDLNIDPINKETIKDQEFCESMSLHRVNKTKQREELALLEQKKILPLVSEEIEKRPCNLFLKSAETVSIENEIVDGLNIKVRSSFQIKLMAVRKQI
ncbi:hypothetical protein WA026_010696 [Henosepilachna vigintioctopunctata]|uniref:C2HC/C3H-type domain-containing protein n=1 Tax=Henosepilachna vigintioctopunctata TaxID=420089 RepID=A0AAW1UWB4_9CUCU